MVHRFPKSRRSNVPKRGDADRGFSKRGPAKRGPAIVGQQSSPARGSENRGPLVMGRRCSAELVRLSPERIREAWMLPLRDEQDADFKKLAAELEKLSIPRHQADRAQLTNMVQSDSHQGIVLRVAERRFENLSDWLDSLTDESGPKMLLAIDAVQDPMNFGAILRIAECFGVSAVLWSKNRSVALSPVVSKASVGASELVSLLPVSNLQEALERCKRAGFWVVAADISPEATSLPSFEFPHRCVLVMGSEGSGIQPLIMKSVDFRITIPMRGRIDSLNVSQATAVIVSAWCSGLKG